MIEEKVMKLAQPHGNEINKEFGKENYANADIQDIKNVNAFYRRIEF
jgi:hypothetical protein